MISSIFWNIRGVGNNSSIRRLKRLMEKNSLVLVTIQEPKIGKCNLQEVCKKLNFEGGLSNCNSKRWIVWKYKCETTLVRDNDQSLSVSINIPHMGDNIIFTSCLWEDINFLASLNYEKWVLGGEFNIISSHDEKWEEIWWMSKQFWNLTQLCYRLG